MKQKFSNYLSRKKFSPEAIAKKQRLDLIRQIHRRKIIEWWDQFDYVAPPERKFYATCFDCNKDFERGSKALSQYPRCPECLKKHKAFMRFVSLQRSNYKQGVFRAEHRKAGYGYRDLFFEDFYPLRGALAREFEFFMSISIVLEDFFKKDIHFIPPGVQRESESIKAERQYAGVEGILTFGDSLKK